jgi:hypothetical protein
VLFEVDAEGPAEDEQSGNAKQQRAGWNGTAQSVLKHSYYGTKAKS